MALLCRAWFDRLEVVERTAEALHQKKDEGGDEDGADHHEPAALVPTRRRGRRPWSDGAGTPVASDRAVAGPVPVPVPVASVAGPRRRHSRRRWWPARARPVPWGERSRGRVRLDPGRQPFQPAAAPPQLDGVAAQDGEGDAVAGVDVAHASPSDHRSRRATSRSAPSSWSERTWMR